MAGHFIRGSPVPILSKVIETPQTRVATGYLVPSLTPKFDRKSLLFIFTTFLGYRELFVSIYLTKASAIQMVN